MQHLEFGHLEFIARADRTLWHKKSDTLFLSDLHLGKGAHFRQAGIPIPEASELSDLDRLMQAVKDTQAKTVWVLGDLFHQPQSISSVQMDRWQHVLDPLHVELKVILGNHDRQAESFACTLGFFIYPEPTLWRGIELAHHPDDDAAYRIAGHIHPQVEFKAASDRLSYPCFAIKHRRLLLLPAFTAFSGGPRFQPKDAQCFAIVNDDVLPATN
ncbi:MAG: ligase-associated DNA damage response endonuclease PdeM [Pseudomonadota bacterium]|nr:ligase-associated DNA damage response endonuclease PdeM [Pseudomonadota bacterium]